MTSSAAAPSGGEDERPGIPRHVWPIALVVVLGSIMSVLDTTIVNVALDDLSTELHASLDDIQWVVTGYLLSLAAIIPVTGWAATRYDAKKLYIGSLIVFTLGSVLCGLSWSSGSLIAARVFQGIGGGMIAPIGQMILVRAAGPRNVPRIMSVIGVPIVLAPVFGPTVGGLLIEHAGWEWIFFINLPVGIIAVIAATRLLPHTVGSRDLAGKLDAIGLALVATGLVGVTYGLAQSGQAGSLVDSSVLLPFVAGLILIGLFAVRALRIDRPLLNIRLLSNKAFAAASITTFCLGAAIFAAMVLMPLYFQTVRGEDAVATGLLLIPQGVGAAIAMGLSGRATERWGGGITSLIGGAITIVSTIPFVLIAAHTSYPVIDFAMIVRGFGIGMSIMPAMTAAFTVLEPDQINNATPQLNVFQRVGGSVGTAIIAVVLSSKISDAGPGATPEALADAFGSTYLYVMAVTVVALVPTIVLAVIEHRARVEQDIHAVPDERLAALETEAV
ncbi:DHA2 family efflux MFS transporter permease subunit [Conexibacter sp. CPCC 206217]|uniref:DHA2 family efflux MFS transporter permease subunit n=1 Tax=Conexibacter sp. CPCC 206217 TaxID=3064574 RepID=UPI002717833B|nr:DHA2 family efflux MFS transporter permease subunit [Conexibacter sp. CPCC 206217]MDO8211070.1 DHA2 family efflux MFS transporter permease subunit [Conexibacter sp. CPCC 206217]